MPTIPFHSPVHGLAEQIGSHFSVFPFFTTEMLHFQRTKQLSFGKIDCTLSKRNTVREGCWGEGFGEK